jgi:hypothetical protein
MATDPERLHGSGTEPRRARSSSTVYSPRRSNATPRSDTRALGPARRVKSSSIRRRADATRGYNTPDESEATFHGGL